MQYVIVGLFILLDVLCGLIYAFMSKTYKSSIMRTGLFHKCGSILCVVFGALIDYAQTFIDLGIQLPVSLAICTYIILMEAGSIIEEVCKINPNIAPEKLTKYFGQLNGKE